MAFFSFHFCFSGSPVPAIFPRLRLSRQFSSRHLFPRTSVHAFIFPPSTLPPNFSRHLFPRSFVLQSFPATISRQVSPPSDLFAPIKPIEDRHDIQLSETMVCVGPCEKCVSGFHITASEHLARYAINLQVDGRLVSCEEIVQSESHLALLGAKLCLAGFPYRTPLQISAKLL